MVQRIARNGSFERSFESSDMTSFSSGVRAIIEAGRFEKRMMICGK
jgi:hypothetical protein